jgi:repressor LexA
MLTDRQQQLLDYIRDQQQSSGFTPSTREIQRHFGFGSQTAVMDHLRALERKGALERKPRKARSILLANTLPRRPIIDIPIYGTIPAGMPADQHQESDGTISIALDTIRLPKGSRVFALKVRGDSMVNAGIHDNDTVILEWKEPQNRNVVAALIEGETTLKTYIVRRGKPFLRAENPKYPDLIPARELLIQGVMIALLRLVK